LTPLGTGRKQMTSSLLEMWSAPDTPCTCCWTLLRHQSKTSPTHIHCTAQSRVLF
jgi:hypothetical protein